MFITARKRKKYIRAVSTTEEARDIVVGRWVLPGESLLYGYFSYRINLFGSSFIVQATRSSEGIVNIRVANSCSLFLADQAESNLQIGFLKVNYLDWFENQAKAGIGSGESMIRLPLTRRLVNIYGQLRGFSLADVSDV